MSDLTPQLDPTQDDLFEQAMARIHNMDPANQPSPEPIPQTDLEPETPEPTEPVEQSPAEEEPEPEGGGVEATQPAPPPPSDWIEIDESSRLSREEAKQLFAFQQWLKANPAAANLINETLKSYQPGTQPTPPPPPPPTPDFVDTSDPFAVWMVEQINNIQAQQAQIAQSFAARTQLDTDREIETAKQTWNSHYKFSPDELSRIEQEGANLRILPGLLAQGLTIEQATSRTLETALRSIPEIYDRYLSQRSTDQRKLDNEQKVKSQKLGALAGRTGVASVPTPPPTPADKRAAMVNDIATALSGQ